MNQNINRRKFIFLHISMLFSNIIFAFVSWFLNKQNALETMDPGENAFLAWVIENLSLAFWAYITLVALFTLVLRQFLSVFLHKKAASDESEYYSKEVVKVAVLNNIGVFALLFIVLFGFEYNFLLAFLLPVAVGFRLMPEEFMSKTRPFDQ